MVSIQSCIVHGPLFVANSMILACIAIKFTKDLAYYRKEKAEKRKSNKLKRSIPKEIRITAIVCLCSMIFGDFGYGSLHTIYYFHQNQRWLTDVSYVISFVFYVLQDSCLYYS